MDNVQHTAVLLLAGVYYGVRGGVITVQMKRVLPHTVD